MGGVVWGMGVGDWWCGGVWGMGGVQDEWCWGRVGCRMSGVRNGLGRNVLCKRH